MPNPRGRKRGYQHKSNAVNITVHTQKGDVLPPEAKQQVLDAIEVIARRYGLLTNVVES